MNRAAAASGAMVLAAACAIGFLVIAVHELDYASSHPHAFGPAKIIAWAAFAGAGLGFAVGALAYALRQPSEKGDE